MLGLGLGLMVFSECQHNEICLYQHICHCVNGMIHISISSAHDEKQGNLEY